MRRTRAKHSKATFVDNQNPQNEAVHLRSLVKAFLGKLLSWFEEDTKTPNKGDTMSKMSFEDAIQITPKNVDGTSGGQRMLEEFKARMPVLQTTALKELSRLKLSETAKKKSFLTQFRSAQWATALLSTLMFLAIASMVSVSPSRQNHNNSSWSRPKIEQTKLEKQLTPKDIETAEVTLNPTVGFIVFVILTGPTMILIWIIGPGLLFIDTGLLVREIGQNEKGVATYENHILSIPETHDKDGELDKQLILNPSRRIHWFGLPLGIKIIKIPTNVIRLPGGSSRARQEIHSESGGVIVTSSNSIDFLGLETANGNFGVIHTDWKVQVQTTTKKPDGATTSRIEERQRSSMPVPIPIPPSEELRRWYERNRTNRSSRSAKERIEHDMGLTALGVPLDIVIDAYGGSKFLQEAILTRVRILEKADRPNNNEKMEVIDSSIEIQEQEVPVHFSNQEIRARMTGGIVTVRIPQTPRAIKRFLEMHGSDPEMAIENAGILTLKIVAATVKDAPTKIGWHELLHFPQILLTLLDKMRAQIEEETGFEEVEYKFDQIGLEPEFRDAANRLSTAQVLLQVKEVEAKAAGMLEFEKEYGKKRAEAEGLSKIMNLKSDDWTAEDIQRLQYLTNHGQMLFHRAQAVINGSELLPGIGRIFTNQNNPNPKKDS